MSIVCLNPQTDPLWWRLIEQHQSSVFHSPEWVQVLAETYGLEINAYMMLDGMGEPRAGIPFCQIADITGKRIVTLPFSDYCDPLINDRDHWNCLIEKLLSEQCTIIVRCLYNNLPLADERFTLAKQAKWHGLDLRPDLDTLWHSLHDSSRRAIKKAQREEVVVRIAQREEELRAFFDLHLRIRKYKYRLLAQPYRFLENIWHQFVEKKSGSLLVAVHQGNIVGGALFLEWKDTLYYKFNASASADLGHRPNDLLIWEGIKYGKTKGYTYLDLGLSDQDQEGLVRFKRKFATDEKTISFLRYTPNGVPVLQDNQVRNLLAKLTSLFTLESVPDNVTDRAGEILYRFFA